MKREPKTPRTKRHRVRYWFHPDSFTAWYGRYRRLPKGKRAKSGQWWRRTTVDTTKTFAKIVNEAWGTGRTVEWSEA